ncbi:hypothetical protein NN561_012600 [Cricetulus griseus]
MVPRGDKDLAFRTRGRQAVPVFMLSPRSWEGAASAWAPSPETLSAGARRAPCWPRMSAHPLPGLERCGIFCLRRGGHEDGKGLQVAKLGGQALCGVRGYVFLWTLRFSWGSGGDMEKLRLRIHHASWSVK